MNSSNNTVARKKNAVFQRHIVPRKKKRMNCSNVFFFLVQNKKRTFFTTAVSNTRHPAFQACTLPLTPPFLHVCQSFPQAASQQQDITTNTRAPRGQLRRRNNACLLPLWKQFPLRTGSGLGRLAEQSC